MWKGLLDEWGEQTGAAYRLVEYEDGTAAKKDLPTADLIVLPFAEMGEFVAADRLSLMPPAMVSGDSATAWLDYFSGLRERVLTIGGAPAIIPFSCPVLTCYYRQDLLEKAGKKPPRTWDEYQALVESLPSWAPGLSAAEPWGPEFRATMFLARALLGGEGSRHFFGLFRHRLGGAADRFARICAGTRAIVERGLQDAGGRQDALTPADCRRLILTGKAAIGVSFEPGRADLKPLERPKGISLSFVRLPGTRQVYSHSTKAWTQSGAGSQRSHARSVCRPGGGGRQGNSRQACRGGVEPGVLTSASTATSRPSSRRPRASAASRSLPDRPRGSAPICGPMNSSVIGE